MEPSREPFEKLRRLLTLKRHELPPPGFHDRLARSIRRELESGAAAPKRSPLMAWLAWWRRFGWEAALATAVLGVLAALYGLMWWEARLKPTPDPSGAMLTDIGAPGDPAVSRQLGGTHLGVSNRAPFVEGLAGEPPSAGHTSGPPPGLFSPGLGLTPTPASFPLHDPAARPAPQASNTLGSNAHLRPVPPR